MEILSSKILLNETFLDEKNFHLMKTNLSNREGLSYIDFKKKLTPQYQKVWLDILSGWFSLIVVMITAYFLLAHFETTALKTIISFVAALTVGYIIAYLTNFFHEAAHYNIASDKNKNDVLANIFIGLLLGQSIKYYRIIHWEHHKNLGTPADSETSYFESLNLKFILYSLTGIRVLRILLKRNNLITVDTKRYTEEVKKEAKTLLIGGLIFNLIFVISMALYHQWWLVAIWVMATFCFYPLFNSLRQLLEHRSDLASKKVNYSTSFHGKLNRLFGDNFFDRTFGSAGFNRHLLHHLEPMISYTRMKDLEIFLSETNLIKDIQNSKTSYLKTFIKLFNK